LTIKNGVIVEDGNHDQLVTGDGRYAALHRIQSTDR
jgi:ABC-type multidrug transport system fused ATPase/permease subunit